MDSAATDRPTPRSHRSARTTGDPAVVSHRHGAAVVGTPEEMLAAALPFLDEGLHAGDLVVLTCPPETVELITAHLGTRAREVESEPRVSLLGARAPDALEMARRFQERAEARGSGRLRVLADIDFGADPADWREGQRYESVTNRLLTDAVSALCVYDEGRLPAKVVESAAATHPHLVRGSAWTVNPEFQDPWAYVPSLPLPRTSIEDGEPVFAVDDAPTLAGLRRQLGAVLATLVADRDRREELHLATSEIAANAFRHGVRPVSARVWADGGRLICVISDRGTSYTNPFSGFTPAHGPDLSLGGMGLWLARKLWDHVDLLPTPEGLSVRLSTHLR